MRSTRGWKLIYFVVAAGMSVAGSRVLAQTGSTPAGQTQPQTFQLIPSLDKDLMDTAADPCVDFYHYACGNWSKLHPIPNDSPYSDQFYNLEQYNRQVLHQILETAAAPSSGRDANSQKIGDYYASCMDDADIQKKGMAPLQPELERINALSRKDQLPELLAHFQLVNVNAFLGFGSQQDFKDATREIAVVSQGGLGLPEKDYYLRTGQKDEEIRKQYVHHIGNMLKLLGASEAQASSEAQAIMNLE
ncbi:MAG: M13 family metallopeptidase N-terminal domain-containing protein, partial [Candidatus Sulfotelmatobacter sp.]